MSQFSLSCSISFFHRLAADTLVCSSLRSTFCLSCLHQPHSCVDGLASRAYVLLIKESRTKKWQLAVPLQLPASVRIPPEMLGEPWNALWSEEGMDGGKRAMSAAGLSVQWSHCGSMMQTHAGTVRRLFCTEGAKSIFHSPPLNPLSFPCCASRDSFSGCREAKAKGEFQLILFQLAYPAVCGKMLCT